MKSMVEIRLGSSSEIGLARSFIEAEGELSPVAIGVLEHNDLVFWLALDGSELLGVLLGRPIFYADGTFRGGVDLLVVADGHRNHGIGRQLMNVAEAHFRQSDATGMLLTVVEGNNPAVHLYESLGYHAVQRRIRMSKDF